jgi:hypothetical protein
MKKPVRAIDMRRTATVLDFAVVFVSMLSHSIGLRFPYLSSPSCDLEWTMRRQGLDSGDGRVNVRLRRCGGEFPFWDVERHLPYEGIRSTCCLFQPNFVQDVAILLDQCENAFA